MASTGYYGTSWDEEERARQMHAEKNQLDLQSRRVHAKREGRKQVIELLKSGKSLQEIEYKYEITLGDMLFHEEWQGRQEVIDLFRSGKSLEEVIGEYDDAGRRKADH